ncbi:MAG: hypothetical protein KDE51_17545 [Anaerolineales bacterium]|nr:hypothetical protein [Anaerolineales bacterium]
MINVSLKKFFEYCIYIFLVILVGCSNNDSTVVHYDNELDFSIEYPTSWQLENNERMIGEVTLDKPPSLINDGSARIEFSFGRIIREENLFLEDTMLEGMEENIKNTISKYESNTAEVLLHPEVVSTSFGFIVVSTISIDTYALPDGSEKNRTGFMDENHEQIIEKYYFVDPKAERFASATLYYGLDEKINKQANEIINSLRFIEK